MGGHFLAQPVRAREGFVRVVQLHLSHDQSGVVAQELVDFEGVVAYHHEVAVFFQQRPFAQGQQRRGIIRRDAVFEFLADEPGRHALHRHPRFGEVPARVFGKTHANRGLRRVGEVALPETGRRLHGSAPAFAVQQELAFDFGGHGFNPADWVPVRRPQCFQRAQCAGTCP